MRMIVDELREGKNVSEDNRLNIRTKAKQISDAGMREEIQNLLEPLKGEFEQKVEVALEDYADKDRFNTAWDTVNLLIDGKKKEQLKKLLLLRIVNETHSGINVTATNKKELKKRIEQVTDTTLKTALMNRLQTKEEVELYSPDAELKRITAMKEHRDDLSSSMNSSL